MTSLKDYPPPTETPIPPSHLSSPPPLQYPPVQIPSVTRKKKGISTGGIVGIVLGSVFVAFIIFIYLFGLVANQLNHTEVGPTQTAINADSQAAAEESVADSQAAAEEISALIPPVGENGFTREVVAGYGSPPVVTIIIKDPDTNTRTYMENGGDWEATVFYLEASTLYSDYVAIANEHGCLLRVFVNGSDGLGVARFEQEELGGSLTRTVYVWEVGMLGM
ncbi:MAG: hypothetical protein LBK67_00030 [Coriobacteriales bacterium]|nr:hypothetical protein [Coriobacteriales bacterium]